MVTLIATIWIASWTQNKRFDDLRADIAARFAEVNRRFEEVNRRIDEILLRLERIEHKQDDHEQRIVRLEERTSLVRT